MPDLQRTGSDHVRVVAELLFGFTAVAEAALEDFWFKTCFRNSKKLCTFKRCILIFFLRTAPHTKVRLNYQLYFALKFCIEIILYYFRYSLCIFSVYFSQYWVFIYSLNNLQTRALTTYWRGIYLPEIIMIPILHILTPTAIPILEFCLVYTDIKSFNLR